MIPPLSPTLNPLNSNIISMSQIPGRVSMHKNMNYESNVIVMNEYKKDHSDYCCDNVLKKVRKELKLCLVIILMCLCF